MSWLIDWLIDWWWNDDVVIKKTIYFIISIKEGYEERACWWSGRRPWPDHQIPRLKWSWLRAGIPPQTPHCSRQPDPPFFRILNLLVIEFDLIPSPSPQCRLLFVNNTIDSAAAAYRESGTLRFALPSKLLTYVICCQQIRVIWASGFLQWVEGLEPNFNLWFGFGPPHVVFLYFLFSSLMQPNLFLNSCERLRPITFAI